MLLVTATLLLVSLSDGREYIDPHALCVCLITVRHGVTDKLRRYWFKYIIVTPNQLTAAALVIQDWVDRDRVNPGVFIVRFYPRMLSPIRRRKPLRLTRACSRPSSSLSSSASTTSVASSSSASSSSGCLPSRSLSLLESSCSPSSLPAVVAPMAMLVDSDTGAILVLLLRSTRRMY